MSKKVRVNRQFDSLFECADYLNYFLRKNPEARITMSDLKRIAEVNGWELEDQSIDTQCYRPVLTDSEGQCLGLVMQPSFAVFDLDCEDGDPDDDDPEEEEESEEEEADGEEPEEEESEEEDTEEEESSDEPTTEETFDWVKPGETFVWRDPQDDSEHSAEVVEVKSEDGKVHTTTTEIRAKVEGIDGVISIFCDEIVMEDDDPEEEEDDSNPPDPDEIEDAEIVEDPADADEPSDDSDD